jgi:hypothetical protein
VADKRDPWLEEDFRVLTPDAFDFVLANELKRAVRSQNFLTLLLVQPRAGEPETDAADPEVLQQVGRLISPELSRGHRPGDVASPALPVLAAAEHQRGGCLVPH